MRHALTVFLAFGIRLASAGLLFLGQIGLTRVLGITEYAAYAVIVAWTTPVAGVASLGFQQSILRFASHYRAAEDWGSFRALRCYVDRTLGWIFSGMLLLLLPVLYLLKPATPYSWASIFLACSIVLLSALMQVRASFLRSLGQTLAAITPDSLLRGALLLLFLLAFHLLNWQVHTGEALAIGALSLLIGLLVSEALLRHYDPSREAQVSRQDPAWRSVTAYAFLYLVATSLVARFTPLVLTLAVSPHEFALFAVSWRVSDVALFPQWAITMVYAPLIAVAFGVKDRPALGVAIGMSCLMQFAMTAATSAAMILFSSEIVRLFGPEFAGAEPYLELLAYKNLVVAAFGPVAGILSMTGLERPLLAVSAITGAINLALCYVLGLLYGATGGVLAQAGAEIAMAVVCWIVLTRSAVIVPLTVLQEAAARWLGIFQVAVRRE